MVLWDFKARCADVRCQAIEPLRSPVVSWVVPSASQTGFVRGVVSRASLSGCQTVNGVFITPVWLELWTSGYGRCGQLGHGTADNCPIPRTVLDLCGSKVGQVACGRGHTLVYIPSQGHVYAFDQGLSGQPGTKTPHSRELPQVVVCPWLSPGGASLLDYAEEDSPSVCLRQIFAGGDVSLATVSRESGGAEDFCSPPLPRPNALSLTIQEHMIKKLLSIEEEDMIDDDLFTFVLAFKTWPRVFLRIPPARTPYAVMSFPCTRTSLTLNKRPNSKRRMLREC
ncbi:probable E3 ubiquitin-protein ligase HERC4 [Scylla paramamosain]|uniref:probable E3 ubiquitin-protein ligase HERC4 n=1 Tax=Scylla paramamosain TaxID=85552 RepID=UPI003082FE35